MPLTRTKRWRTIELNDFFVARRSVSFAWGSNDCALFAADAIQSYTGVDIASDFRGDAGSPAYTAQASAFALIAKVTGVETPTIADAAAWCAAKHGLTEREHPLCAQAGDLVVMKNSTASGIVPPAPANTIAGVVHLNGRDLVSMGPDGPLRISILNVVRAWHVVLFFALAIAAAHAQTPLPAQAAATPAAQPVPIQVTLTAAQLPNQTLNFAPTYGPQIINGTTSLPPGCVYNGASITCSGNYQSLAVGVPALWIQSTPVPVIVQNSAVSGRGGALIDDVAGNALTVTNTVFTGLQPQVGNQAPGMGIYAQNQTALTVTGNTFTGLAIGVQVARGVVSPLAISNNAFNAMQDWSSTGYRPGLGHAILVDTLVAPAGGDIGWNQIITVAGQGSAEDQVNIYNSAGVAGSVINVHDNYVSGAMTTEGDHYTGSCFIADGAPGAAVTNAFITFQNNQCVQDAGSGYEIWYGHDIQVLNNRCISSGVDAAGTWIGGMEQDDAYEPYCYVMDTAFQVLNIPGFNPATSYYNLTMSGNYGGMVYRNASGVPTRYDANLTAAGSNGNVAGGNTYVSPATAAGVTPALEAAELALWQTKTSGVSIGATPALLSSFNGMPAQATAGLVGRINDCVSAGCFMTPEMIGALRSQTFYQILAGFASANGVGYLTSSPAVESDGSLHQLRVNTDLATGCAMFYMGDSQAYFQKCVKGGFDFPQGLWAGQFQLDGCPGCSLSPAGLSWGANAEYQVGRYGVEHFVAQGAITAPAASAGTVIGTANMGTVSGLSGVSSVTLTAWRYGDGFNTRMLCTATPSSPAAISYSATAGTAAGAGGTGGTPPTFTFLFAAPFTGSLVYSCSGD